MQPNWISVEDSHKGFMNALSGAVIDFRNPNPEMFSIEDIAAGLSKECRFAGQIKSFYSVAQHSVMMARLVLEDTGDPELAYAALLHDAPEAFIKDMPKPVKIIIGEVYDQIERAFMEQISIRFCIRVWCLDQLKKWDLQMLKLEHEALHGIDAFPFVKLAHRIGFKKYDRYWSCHTAETLFLQEYKRLWLLVKERRTQ